MAVIDTPVPRAPECTLDNLFHLNVLCIPSVPMGKFPFENNVFNMRGAQASGSVSPDNLQTIPLETGEVEESQLFKASLGPEIIDLEAEDAGALRDTKVSEDDKDHAQLNMVTMFYVLKP